MLLKLDKISRIVQIKDDVVYAMGIIEVGMSEMVNICMPGTNIDIRGVVNYLDRKGVTGIAVLGDTSNLKVGHHITGLKELPKVNIGYKVLGRIMDSIGNTIDGLDYIKAAKRKEVESIAPSIIAREPIYEQLETGLKFIDALIPIGCGQRELIVGDPKTGKTTIVLDSIINQRYNNLLCVYVAIGQKQTTLSKIKKVLTLNNCDAFTTIIFAGAGNSSVMQYIAPYAGCTIGEYFMNLG